VSALPELFDPRTLIFISCLLALLCSIILFLQRHSFPKSVGGLQYWGYGCMAIVAASGLLGIGDIWSQLLFTVVIANGLLVGGFMLIYAGLLDFFGRRPNPRPLAAGLAVIVCLLTWSTFVYPHYEVQVLTVTAANAVLLFACAQVVFKEKQRGLAALFTGTAFLATAMISALRFMVTLTYQDASAHLLDTSPLQKLYLASFAFSVFILTVGLMTMANDRLRTTLEHIAAHDALTGAFSRGTFLDLLAKELVRSQRHRRPVALLMLDLDHFKAINDRYGHPIGDRVIVDFVNRTGALLRQHDFLGRYGGEEFMVLLPETTLDAACAVARRICANTALPSTADLPTYTVSIGVALARDGNMLRETLLEIADKELYRAKENGRNRVEPAEQADVEIEAHGSAAHQA
jgi:diguanylate cyclase (GGDEF)-like protein